MSFKRGHFVRETRIFVARRGTVRRQELRGGTPWGSDDGKTLSSPGPGAEKRKIVGDTVLELTISTCSCFRVLSLLIRVRVIGNSGRVSCADLRLRRQGRPVGIKISACLLRVVDHESCKLVRVSRCVWLSLCISASSGLEVEVPLHKFHVWNR